MVVCDYCQTSFYWDRDRTAHMGEKSVLPESDSRLYLDASGKILGKGYRVVGHVRYEHYSGAWDEWYLDIGGTKAAWVSEDERNLTLERRLKPDEPLPAFEQLAPGMRLKLSGRVFTVREAGRATCVGGEGQLPFPVLPGEEYPYIDIATADGEQFGTVEWDESGEVHAFLGRPLEHKQLTLDAPKPEPERDESAGATDVECPSCGAPLEKPEGRTVETLVCAYCGANNDLTGAAAKTMGVNPKGLEPKFRFAIGKAATFQGARYEVCGRMLYRDEESYESREYLLWNPERGYLWLGEEDDQYVLLEPTRKAPRPDPLTAGPLLRPKSPIKVGDQPFEFFEKGSQQLVYVDGALPWQASVTQSVGYATLVAPPRIFEMEVEGGEVEYFQGTYLPPDEVWQAFGRKPPAPLPRGVHPAQPFQRGPVATALMWVGGIFALVNLALLAFSYIEPGREMVLDESFSPRDYTKESLSRQFEIGGGKVMELDLQSAVTNAWLALDVALMDQKNQVQAESSSEVSYYEGFEDGEYWREGSQESTAYFRAPPPGTYQLIVKGETGDGPPAQVHVRLYEGGMLSRYFLVLALLCGLLPGFEYLRWRLFEARRWASTLEDEDDDDDEGGLLDLIS